MKNSKILISILFLFFFHTGFSCSMYKVTKNGKTIVGCNEDAWRTSSHIWFEVGNNNSYYGTAFTGSRFDGKNGYAPQSGMNEYGLVFSRLASYHPENKIKKNKNRLKITNPTFYLKDILHTCRTVEDVKKYIEKHDYSYFIEDVFIYIDKSGKYIVIEPYKILSGNNASYILSNFCPSITSKEDSNKLERYKNGTLFLKNKLATDLEFCKNLSDTMHVCRDKIGDGTLLTSIWNSSDGIVNLYFYHDYNKSIQFNIKDELSKGNHIIRTDSLFPKNKEFEKLAAYKTPQNNSKIRLFLMLCGLFFMISSVYFLMNYIKTVKNKNFNTSKVFLILFGFILFYYMYVLCTNINIFYFSSPYKSIGNTMVTITSYLPYVLLLLLFPFLKFNYRLIKEKLWNKTAVIILSINNLLYLILIGFFMYWRFYFNF